MLRSFDFNSRNLPYFVCFWATPPPTHVLLVLLDCPSIMQAPGTLLKTLQIFIMQAFGTPFKTLMRHDTAILSSSDTIHESNGGSLMMLGVNRSNRSNHDYLLWKIETHDLAKLRLNANSAHDR